MHPLPPLHPSTARSPRAARLALAAFAAVASLAAARTADASPTDGGVSVALLGGYGAPLSSPSCANGETCNPYGVGLGARAGVTLPLLPLYVGGTFVYHIGYSKDFAGGGTGSSHAYYPGLEAGYGFGLGPLMVRPYLGVGPLFRTASTSIPAQGNVPAMDTHTDDHPLAFWPGLTVAAGVGSYFIGADARYLFTNSTSDPIAIFGTIGMTLVGL